MHFKSWFLVRCYYSFLFWTAKQGVQSGNKACCDDCCGAPYGHLTVFYQWSIVNSVMGTVVLIFAIGTRTRQIIHEIQSRVLGQSSAHVHTHLPIHAYSGIWAVNPAETDFWGTLTFIALSFTALASICTYQARMLLKVVRPTPLTHKSIQIQT